MAHADLLVFLVDGREGLVPGDQRIARELRETGRPVLLAINKTDDKRSMKSALEFYELGFDPVFEISAEHGTGVAELMDEIVSRIGIRESEFGTRSDESTEAAGPSPESSIPDPESRIPRPGCFL